MQIRFARAGALFLAWGLAGPAAAGPESWGFGRWELGAGDGARFGCDTTPLVRTSQGLALQDGDEGPVRIGAVGGAAFPPRLRATDGYDATLGDDEVRGSCSAVRVRYHLGGPGEPLACADAELLWERDGAEEDVILHDGGVLGTSRFEEGRVGSVRLRVPGPLLPGEHEVAIRVTARNAFAGGDGLYVPRRLALRCEPLAAFVTAGGSHDERAALPAPDSAVPADPPRVVSGTVGVRESDGAAVGALRIRYREAFGQGPASCRFRPGPESTVAVADGVATLGRWEVACTAAEGSLETAAPRGTASLVLVGDGGAELAPTGGPRGALCVASDEPELAVGAAREGACAPVDLDRGRARVVGRSPSLAPAPAVGSGPAAAPARGDAK